MNPFLINLLQRGSENDRSPFLYRKSDFHIGWESYVEQHIKKTHHYVKYLHCDWLHTGYVAARDFIETE